MASVFQQRFNTPAAPTGAYIAASPSAPGAGVRPQSPYGMPSPTGGLGLPSLPPIFSMPAPTQMYAYNQVGPQPSPAPAASSWMVPDNQAKASDWFVKEGGGGGGGGEESGSGSPDMPSFTDPAAGQADYVWGVLKGIISGQDVPFTPKVIDTQKGQAKLASETGFSQAKNQLQAQQAASGYASSPAAGSQLVAARAAASDQYGKASAGIDVAAAQQNFAARMSALAGAQQWIDSLRSFVSTMTGNWWQRQTAMEQVALAQDRLNQEMELAWAQFGMGSLASPAPSIPGGA